MTEQYFTGAEGFFFNSAIIPCRKMLALLDCLELFVFLLYCLAGVTERNSPGPWILKPVASGVRWA